jgi:hypothetical protein
MKTKPHAMKLYVSIQFDSHEYTATITEPGQLTRFLSRKNEAFRIMDIWPEHQLPSTGFPSWVIAEMNACTRFGKSKNVTSKI